MYKEVTRKIIISSFDDMLPGYFMATSVSNYFPNGSSIINGIITSCVKTTDPTVYHKTLKVLYYEDYFEMFCSLRWTFQFCKLMIKKGFEGKKVAPPHRILNEETVFSDSGSMSNPKFAFNYRGHQIGREGMTHIYKSKRKLFKCLGIEDCTKSRPRGFFITQS